MHLLASSLFCSLPLVRSTALAIFVLRAKLHGCDPMLRRASVCVALLWQVVGMARAYEITGNTTDKKIVDTFFEALYNNHSYATAGSNSGECWQAPRDLGNFLDTQTEESCTQYNVLKVARRSFLTSAEASKAARLR